MLLKVIMDGFANLSKSAYGVALWAIFSDNGSIAHIIATPRRQTYA